MIPEPTARPSTTSEPSADELDRLDAYWRAATYLSVGQIYLRDNPLLREPLRPEHVKPRLLGHWGTTPGQTFVYTHLNRAIVARDLDALYVSGPGHGGPAVVAQVYLEGAYTEVYPEVTQDEAGMRRLFRQFSWPGGIPSHVAPETPGSIHEGGELGYSLAHATGAALDNPDLVVACVVGDGEAETGPLAASWHAPTFLSPVSDGAVLPVLHLNGFKIASPTVLARMPREQLAALLRGYGWAPVFVEGDDPAVMHRAMADALDGALDEIARIRTDAREHGATDQPRWPVIVLVTPKGWTGPKEVDGVRVEGAPKSHQVPISNAATDPDHLAALEAWLRSYRPDELFDEAGALRPEIAALAPQGNRRMGASPHAHGAPLRPLDLPPLADYGVDVPTPGAAVAADTATLGPYLRDVVDRNRRTFRVFAPDELESNRLGAVLEATDRQWQGEIRPDDRGLARQGRVLEVLSEHLCEGWLEGYLLTGRHGLFTSYEAFIHVVDSMLNQHAKWLDVAREIPWRGPLASLNILLASHVWRQDHNGFTHQDPGFIDVVLNKKPEVVRAYFPPDANCLLAVMDHCLRTRDTVNVVVAGKHPAPQWLDGPAAAAHVEAGVGVWEWASDRGEPDVVMACAGDVPTLETLAAVQLLREHLPDVRLRVVNVVDIMRLRPEADHPHGLSDAAFDALFTTDRPVVFAHHGYPTLVHRLTYRRTNHSNLHVHGYQEEGAITTPFDMAVLNGLDRFHLAEAAVRWLDLGERGEDATAAFDAALDRHHAYIREHGVDLPEVRDWTWTARSS